MRKISIVAVLGLVLLSLAGCGGGGGGGSSSATTVSGVASKGIIRNGIIKVYAVSADGGKGALLRQTVTDANGAYQADLGDYQGPVLVEASGSYTDEATGAIMTVSADAPLRAAIGQAAGGAQVAVTPLTELAVQKSEDPVTHKLMLSKIDSSNAEIGAIFKVDIVATMPADPLAASPTATEQQKEHALVLAAVSQLMATKGEDLAAVIAELKGAIGSDHIFAGSAATEMQNALSTFVASTRNATGITDLSATRISAIGGSTRTLTVTATAAGTLSLPVVAMDVIVRLPAGVSVGLTADGKLKDNVVQMAPGFAGPLSMSAYNAATLSARAGVHVAAINLDGFALGQLFTVTCNIAPGATPVATDFVPVPGKVFDRNGELPEGSVTLSAVLSP